MTGLDHLWAGWRSTYIDEVSQDPQRLQPDGDGSLFERILAMPDEDGLVVHRGDQVATVLNAFPYTNGHCLVVPAVAAADLGDLSGSTAAELWIEVQHAVAAVRAAYRCHGVNVGLNLGAAAGAGVPDHLHVHVLPRWDGDTNFMTSVADARVLPQPLVDTWRSLRDGWPTG